MIFPANAVAPGCFVLQHSDVRWYQQYMSQPYDKKGKFSVFSMQ
jgi:hypothetical protein